MFDFVSTHKRLILIILLILIIPPFAVFGIDQYFRGGGGGQAVARVGDYLVSTEEFGRALRDQQEALRRATEGRVDPAALDTPELRARTVEGLIQRRLLLEGALRAGMTVSDERLQSAISAEPSFHDETGRFSLARYEQALRAEGRTPSLFEARLRQDMMVQQFADGYADTGFVPRSVVERLARFTEQQREVSHAVVAPEKFLDRVKLEGDAARKYYDANPAEFRIPEQARVEYVVLSIAALMKDVQLDPGAARQFYEANRRQFEVPESRQASHIFFALEAGAGPEAKDKTRARAQEIYQLVRKKPGSFAELARKHSQDPGSAAKGGDLGQLPRGTMKDVPEFEEALYQLKPGEISAPVESKLGFHIIRATAVQPAQGKSFEAVRVQIEADLRRQSAARKFTEIADTFNNVVYEQSDSLKPAATLAKGAVQTSGWVTRARAAEPALNHPKLLAAIFSDESLNGKRNTEAIEVSQGTLVAARVIEHKAEGTQPFETVKEAVEKTLARREAGRLAAAEGRRLLEELKQGGSAQVGWTVPRLAGLNNNDGMPEAVLRQAFRADASKLPAYAGVENLLGGYTLVRVTRVQEAEKIPPQRVEELAATLRRVHRQEELTAYLAALRQKVGVTVFREQLEKKER